MTLCRVFVTEVQANLDSVKILKYMIRLPSKSFEPGHFFGGVCEVLYLKISLFHIYRAIQMIFFTLHELWQLMLLNELLNFIYVVKFMCVELFKVFSYCPCDVLESVILL